jgi:hypothetical protein
MIPLTNYDFQWGRSEVVIIYPDKYIYIWKVYSAGASGSGTSLPPGRDAAQIKTGNLCFCFFKPGRRDAYWIMWKNFWGPEMFLPYLVFFKPWHALSPVLDGCTWRNFWGPKKCFLPPNSFLNLIPCQNELWALLECLAFSSVLDGCTWKTVRGLIFFSQPTPRQAQPSLPCRRPPLLPLFAACKAGGTIYTECCIEELLRNVKYEPLKNWPVLILEGTFVHNSHIYYQHLG